MFPCWKGSANAPSSGKKPKMAREGAYVPTGKPRGRPPKKGSVKRGPYVPTGKPRGCPPGGWPEKPKIAKKGAYVPTGKPLGGGLQRTRWWRTEVSYWLNKLSCVASWFCISCIGSDHDD